MRNIVKFCLFTILKRSSFTGMDGKAFFHGMGQGATKPKTTGRGDFPELPPPHSARKAPRGAGRPSLPNAHVLKMFQIAKNVSKLVILETMHGSNSYWRFPVWRGSWVCGIRPGGKSLRNSIEYLPSFLAPTVECDFIFIF